MIWSASVVIPVAWLVGDLASAYDALPWLLFSLVAAWPITAVTGLVLAFRNRGRKGVGWGFLMSSASAVLFAIVVCIAIIAILTFTW